MSIRKLNLIRFAGLALLAVLTSLTTLALTSRPSAAKPRPKPIGGLRTTASQNATNEEFVAKMAALRIADRKDYVVSHDILEITPVEDAGQIGLAVDVECWHGATCFPNMPDELRAIRLRVFVFSPDDPGRQGAPVASWQSPAVDMEPGLYQERVPVSIPMRPNARPYPVTVEIVSAAPSKHQAIGSDKIVDGPRGFCGNSLSFRVR